MKFKLSICLYDFNLCISRYYLLFADIIDLREEWKSDAYFNKRSFYTNMPLHLDCNVF